MVEITQHAKTWEIASREEKRRAICTSHLLLQVLSLKNIILLFILFIYLLFSHNKDYTSITLYKDVARGPQKTTRLVRGGPLVTIILSNRTITTHNNGQYKTHYRYSRKSKTFVLNIQLQYICVIKRVELEVKYSRLKRMQRGFLENTIWILCLVSVPKPLITVTKIAKKKKLQKFYCCFCLGSTRRRCP